MQIFLTTFFLFVVAMAIHLATWKVKQPRNHTRALLIIFALVYIAWLVICAACAAPLLGVLQVSFYYWPVSLCYIITYSAIEGDSPTLSLMRFIAANGANGRTQEEVARFMAERPFIDARIAALLNSGFIREEGGRYVAAGRKSLAFSLILAFRRLYGSIPKGG